MANIEIDLKGNVITKHRPLIDRIKGRNDYNNFVLSGGRASFKTYVSCQTIIADMVIHAGHGQVMNVAVFMNKRSDIRDGVRQAFENVIDDMGLTKLFTFRMSPMEIEFYNGAKVSFSGLNGQDGKKGNAIKDIGWIWFEEFDQFDGPTSIKPTLDSLQRHAIKGERIKKLYTFNPPKSPYHWVFDYVSGLPEVCNIHTTYLDDDTGRGLISPDLMADIIHAKKNDRAWYEWNYLGEVPKDVETDFPRLIRATDASQEDVSMNEYDRVFCGIDSASRGKDSTVLCAVAYNEQTGKIKLIGFQKFDDVWIDGYTADVVGEKILDELVKLNCTAVNIDPMQGQHIIDYILKHNRTIELKAVNFGAKKSDRTAGRANLATNKRAEMYINASDQLRNKNVVALGDCSELERQLNATDLQQDSRNISVIPKETIKSRIGGKSPDESDAFVLAIQSVYDVMF